MNSLKAAYADKYGTVRIDFNTQGQSILSPDCTKQLLPCGHCLKLEWRNLNTVSFLCEDCFRKFERGELVHIDTP